MKRKVIKQANQAYTLTLPIDWVRANKISEKCEIDVVVDGRSLLVSNEGGVVKKKAKLDVSGFEYRNVYRHINALYAKGVDEIEISSDKEISSLIIKLLNSLIGYVLVSQEDGKYVIKDISGGGYGDLDEVFKRAFQSVILFYDSAISDVFGAGIESESSLRMRDLEVNKLCFYLQRAINKMSYGDAVRGRSLFSYSLELEKIGDDILRFWRANLGKKIKKTKELREIVDLSRKCLHWTFDSYYRFDSKELEKVFDLREKVRKKVAVIKGQDVFARQALRIAEGAVDLNHLVLMMKLE
ncbi:phosphate uptake regulator PhoU [archaeon]|nr:phosphate uptake regulator PhoU [archaeon]MBT7128243.1 phosphate uptake regulator PhoU [archaeon]